MDDPTFDESTARRLAVREVRRKCRRLASLADLQPILTVLPRSKRPVARMRRRLERWRRAWRNL